MSFEEQTARLERLICLINYSYTGKAEKIARKLGVSRRTIFNDLEFLKAKGYAIVYSHIARSYVLEKKPEKFRFLLRECNVVAL